MDHATATDADNDRVDDLIKKTKARIVAKKRFPESTYRLQFHSGFTFRDAVAIVPYLAELGITHLYASPYLKARPGSTHGYDIVDFSVLNPEIGTFQDYEALVDAIRAHQMGHLLDIVPNHMAVATNENAWWNDVLENGRASPQATTFDISWRASPRATLRDKVLIPILGEPYGDALESGKIRLVFENGALAVLVGERRFPTTPRNYGKVLGRGVEEAEARSEARSPAMKEYRSIVDAFNRLPENDEIHSAEQLEQGMNREALKRRLAALAEEEPTIREFVERNVELFNGKEGDPRSFDLFDDFLEHQNYRLSYWRVAPDEINYRRFFDVTDLAALAMEREDVFVAVHDLILRLLAEGKIDGVRVDHPDGLYDPARYFLRLQERFMLACARVEFEADPANRDGVWERTKLILLERVRAEGLENWVEGSRWPLYVIAEKILGAEEELIETWAIDGTSGYDFLNVMNGVFVDSSNEKEFTALYQDLVDDRADFQEIVYRKKILILEAILASELNMLAHQFDRLAQKSRRSRDFTFNTLRNALRDVIACFPVYRSYIDEEDGVHESDRRDVDKALRLAAVRNPLVSERVWDFTRSMLLLEWPETFNSEDRQEQRRFVGKFQQVTAPATAKGIEDTAFYLYNRLVSLNEVGGDPGRFGTTMKQFHEYNSTRQKNWPHALSALSTHDTKRSEDVRARLNVLSEIPDEWRERVQRWMSLNDSRKSHDTPDRNEEYLIYQTLVGAWPIEPIAGEERATFVARIQAFMVKAMHEAKLHTSWLDPNAYYDSAVQAFVARILDEQENAEFLADFHAFQRRVSHLGLFNSLSQSLLKLASPGVPDTYQGSEIWDFSLVDPDNRRPVDYSLRRNMLAELKKSVEANKDRLHEFAEELTKSKEDGRIKLYVHQQVLRLREKHHGLLSVGEYIPLVSLGAKNDHLVAFARRLGDLWAIVAVPRFLTKLGLDDARPPLGKETWQDTRLLIDRACPNIRWRDLFTNRVVQSVERNGEISLNAADAFRHFPVALLIGEREV